MAEVDDLAATIEARLTRARTLVKNPRSTVEPPRPASDERTRHALQAWQSAAATPMSTDGRLAIERTLGEGGMGVVHLAEQVTLGRKVAVKTLRDGARDREAVLKLLREAWITGSLEHPNVVPVYDVGVDASGGPQIVLKRIEGVAWSSVMHDDDEIARRFNALDAFEWNLRILTQVCRAAHFAHARGVLHRDLKPDNVMIGGFGEVYVLDWGIAVALQDDGTGRFPLARDADDMAGTPVYMAPEMLGGAGDRLTPRTDVYLLGAILYELVTGRAPHDGPSMEAIISSILLSSPKLPESLPAELSRVIHRAMAREPEDRYASADELRVAIEAYLRHRGSMRLADSAGESLARLRDELQRGGSRRVLYNLLGECRFGYRAALVECADNDRARGGLRDALLAVTAWELEQNEPESAALLLDDIEAPPPELLARLEEVRRARAADAERIARLASIERDLDKAPGARTRVFLTSVLGTLWVSAPIVRHFTQSLMVRSHVITLGIDLLQIVMIVALGYWARDSMSKTAVNRRIFATLLFTFVVQTVLGVGLWLAGVNAELTHWLHLLLWAAMLGSLVIHLERALWPSAAYAAVAFLIAAVVPGWVYLVMASVSLAIVINLVRVWSPATGSWFSRAPASSS